MISTNQFKTGMTIRFEGDTYRIAEFQHVKPGKGGAFVRTRLKNLKTGAGMEKTFRAGEKVELAPRPSAAKVVSLMEALQRSVAAVQQPGGDEKGKRATRRGKRAAK